ncbi:MAG: hypothetical protein IPP22_07010 [Nitrosomonas sp.]|nr:hypothetical protein [Nitrosomonas sp.]
MVRLRNVVAMALRFSKGSWCARCGANSTMQTNGVGRAVAVGDRNGCVPKEILSSWAPGHKPLFRDFPKRWFVVLEHNLCFTKRKRTVLELWMQIRPTAWTLV